MNHEQGTHEDIEPFRPRQSPSREQGGPRQGPQGRLGGAAADQDQPRRARGGAAAGDHRRGDGGIHFTRLCRHTSRRHRQARRRRQGHHLSALQGQGIDVRGIDPHRDRAAGRPHAGPAAGRRLGARPRRGLCAQLHPRDRQLPARRHRAADRGRRPALSGDCRLLLPRGGLEGPRRHAHDDRTRYRQGRDQERQPREISADHGGSRDDRGDLAEPVCKTRAARCGRDVPHASRSDLRRTA
jgi:hypothetical protein